MRTQRLSRGFILTIALLLAVDQASASYMQISFTVPTNCVSADGSAEIVSNAPTPWTMVWNTGETTSSISGLTEGTYWAELTDGLGDVYSDTVEIAFALGVFSGTPEVAGYLTGLSGFACETQCDATLGFLVSGSGNTLFTNGTLPLTWTFDPPVTYVGSVTVDSGMYGGYEWALYTGFCGGTSFARTCTDALGCQGTWDEPVMSLQQVTSPVPVTPYCQNGSGGTASVSGWNSYACWQSIELWKDGQPLDTVITAIGENSYFFTDLLPGSYVAFCLPIDCQGWPGQCGVSARNFTINDLGPTCGTLQGSVWYDEDVDCVFDGSEHGWSGEILHVTPGSHLAYVGSSGHYALQLPAGNYQVQQQDLYVEPICPAVQPVPVTINSGTTTVDLASSSTEPMDIALFAGSGTPHPGFDQGVHIHAHNHTPQPTGPVTVVCDLDPNTDYLSAAPVPSNVAGNTLTWNLSDLSFFGEASLHVTVDIPSSVPLGTLITHVCTASNVLPEVTLTNNTATTTAVTTGSFDPNDKTARTSTGWSNTQYFIDQDSWIDYTIRFQNTGTDTAFTVVITDTLDSDLDMTTFEQGASSHPVEVAFRTGRVVKWTFDNILLPDSNTNEAASHGLVNFRIKPVLPLLPGTSIINNADIFFDFNEPVRTNDAELVAEISTGILFQGEGGVHVFPNPAAISITVLFVEQQAGFIGVFDMAGSRITLPMERRANSITMDVRELPKGIYALRTATGSARFVKQ